MKSRLLAVIAAISLVMGGLLVLPPASAAAPPQLRDLIVNQSPILEPVFAPPTTTYAATVHRSVDVVDIKPMVVNPGITVTVNGQTPAANGWVKVPVQPGSNTVTVTASKDDQTTSYTIDVTKVDTDFRGRKPVTTVVATSNKASAANAGPENLLDGNPATYWQPAVKPVTTDDPDSDETTKVLLDLGGAHNVSRIQVDTFYAPAAAWSPNIWRNNVDISVSTDDGATWRSVVDKANLREDQGDNSVRWEFGQVYEGVTDIRLSYVKFDAALEHIRWHSLEVFAGEEGAYPEYPAPADAATAPAPANQNIHRSQELIINNGLHLSTWTPSDGYGRGVVNAEEWEAFGSIAPLFYDPDLFNIDFMRQNPDAQWALAKAPWGANDMAAAGEPRNFITEEMEPYLGNALSFAYGDEGLYSLAENQRFREWFDYSKEQWPHVLVHSNQAHGRGWDSVAKMREYAEQARPDILTYDRYPWGWGAASDTGQHAEGSGLLPLYDMLNSPLSKAQRQVALEGLDGTGEKPILFGQYLDNFDYDVSESQKAMTVHASLAFGMKWLDLFRTEFQFDGSFMFDEDGTPTRALYEFARLFEEVRNLSPYLTRLHNEWVGFEAGQQLVDGVPETNSIINGWRMGSVGAAATSVPQYGIEAVEATNVGTINDGLSGDVMLGYFRSLPGLTDADLNDTFGETRHAVMVVNALNGQTLKNGSERWNFLRNDNGQRWQTAQDITVHLADHIAGVRVVEPATGAETVLEIDVAADGSRSITLEGVGGGESRLLLVDGVEDYVPSGPTWFEAEAPENIRVGNAQEEDLYDAASGVTMGYIGGGNGQIGIRVDGTEAGAGEVTLRYFYPQGGSRGLLYACTDSSTPPDNATGGTRLDITQATSGGLADTPAQEITFACDMTEGTTYVWFWNTAGAAGVDGITVNLPAPDPEPTPTQDPTQTPEPTPTPTVTVTATATATTTATVTATATATVTSTATATQTVTATATATQTATATATQTATATATQTFTVTPSTTATVTVTPPATTSGPSTGPGAPVDLYTTPGFHTVGGRFWNTRCEPYSQTIRCRTDIWASLVVFHNGEFVRETGWRFNNLTYLPHMTQQQWGTNPLASPGEFTSDARRWKTECNTATTGSNACRSYIWQPDVVSSTQHDDGTWSHRLTKAWVFNNMVRFKTN